MKKAIKNLSKDGGIVIVVVVVDDDDDDDNDNFWNICHFQDNRGQRVAFSASKSTNCIIYNLYFPVMRSRLFFSETYSKMLIVDI